MSETVWLLRHPDRPGAYILAFRARPTADPNVAEIRHDAEIMRWRDARVQMQAESFNEMCRLSFADWCTRHPEMAPGP